MPFFKSLQNFIQGKPVFEVDQSRARTQKEEAARVASQPAGPKEVPQVYFEERVNCNSNGAKMDCYATVRNNSSQEVELDKVRVLGAMRELDAPSRPGDARQFLIYSGERPKHNYEHDCELQYKDKTGDYFTSQHNVEFRQEADGTYTISRIRYEGLKDI